MPVFQVLGENFAVSQADLERAPQSLLAQLYELQDDHTQPLVLQSWPAANLARFEAVIKCLQGKAPVVNPSLDTASLLADLAYFAIPDCLYPWNLRVIKTTKDKLEKSSSEASAQATEVLSQLRSLLGAQPSNQHLKISRSTILENGLVDSLTLTATAHLYKSLDRISVELANTVPSRGKGSPWTPGPVVMSTLKRMAAIEGVMVDVTYGNQFCVRMMLPALPRTRSYLPQPTQSSASWTFNDAAVKTQPSGPQSTNEQSIEDKGAGVSTGMHTDRVRGLKRKATQSDTVSNAEVNRDALVKLKAQIDEIGSVVDAMISAA